MQTNGKVIAKVPELYRRYRPRKFRDVIGQPEAVTILEEMVRSDNVPHALLLSGNSGIGKTTIARIMASKLGCDKIYCKEINFAESRGIDMVRDIEKDSKAPPLIGENNVKYWILDEIHKGSADALSAALKLLEDPPDYVYYALCTTNPEKLPKTLRTRCTEIRLNPLTNEFLDQVIRSVCVRESLTIPDEIIEKIVECAEGSARQALVLLGKIRGLPGTQEMLASIHKPEEARTAYELSKALVWDKGVRWRDIQRILSELKDADWEGLRHLVLHNAMQELLKPNGNASRAYLILDCFSEPFFNTGKPGLVKACYMVKSESER